MNRPFVRNFVASLTYHVMSTDILSDIACRECRVALDVHQPDPNQPDLFLGTCQDCGRWYRVAPSTGRPGLTVLEVPEVVEESPPSLPSRGGRN